MGQDDGTPDQYDLPPPTKDGVIPVAGATDGSTTKANGAVHQDDAARWAKTGWAPKFGQYDVTEAEAEESLLDHTTFLEGKLDDKFFGGKRFRTAFR